MTMLAADTLVRLLLVVYSKNTKDRGHGQRHVQVYDTIRNGLAYIFEVRSVAAKDTTQGDKGAGPVILIFVDFPISFDTKGDLERARHRDHLLQFYTCFLQCGDSAGFQGIHNGGIPFGPHNNYTGIR